MNRLVLVFWSLFFSYGSAQITNVLKGSVVSGTLGAIGVDVINLNTEISTKTDAQGNFEITVKNSDVLAFYSKEYLFRKIIITPACFQPEKFVVKLIRSAIELDEVVVKNNKIKVPNLNYEQAAEYRIAQQRSYLKNPAVYDGTITNGMDFMEIGRKIVSLFKKSDGGKPKKLPIEDFKSYALSVLDPTFFKEKLKFEKQEIDNFLVFCSEDPESKKVFVNKNELTLLDFLFTKHKDYLERRTNSK